MKYLFYIVLIFNLLGCQKIIENKVPSYLLTENKMATILYDITLFKNSKTNFSDYLKSSGITAEEYLCSKYNVDQVIIEENLDYYSFEPEKIKLIYQNVRDSLEKAEKNLEEIIAHREALSLAKQKKDSIANIKLTEDFPASDSIKQILPN